MNSTAYCNLSASMEEVKDKCSQDTYDFFRSHIANLNREIDYLNIEIESMQEHGRSRRSRHQLEDDWK